MAATACTLTVALVSPEVLGPRVNVLTAIMIALKHFGRALAAGTLVGFFGGGGSGMGGWGVGVGRGWRCGRRRGSGRIGGKAHGFGLAMWPVGVREKLVRQTGSWL